MWNAALHNEGSFPSGSALIYYTTLFCLEIFSESSRCKSACGGRV